MGNLSRLSSSLSLGPLATRFITDISILAERDAQSWRSFSEGETSDMNANSSAYSSQPWFALLVQSGPCGTLPLSTSARASSAAPRSDSHIGFDDVAQARSCGRSAARTQSRGWPLTLVSGMRTELDE